MNRKLALLRLLFCAVFLGQSPALVQLPAAVNDVTPPARAVAAVRAPVPPTPGAETEQAQNGDDPDRYAVIVDRNVFRLVPQPPPPVVETTKPVELPDVKLTGFKDIGIESYVYLAMKPKDPKEPWQFFNKFREGDKGGSPPNTVELVKIHRKEEAVDVIISGTAMSLSLKSNSFASAPAGPAKGGGPGPGGMRMNPRMPGMPPGMPPAAQPFTRPFNTPQATPVTGAIGAGNNSGTVVAGASPINYGAPSQPYGAQTQVYGATTPTPNYGGSSGSTVVAGGPSVNVATPNGGELALNPSVPSRNPQPQANWPPVIPAAPEVQAAALLLHEAAGGPPAPPGLGPEEPGAGGPPSIPVAPVRVR